MVTVDELAEQSLEILKGVSKPLAEISRVVGEILDTNKVSRRSPDFEDLRGRVTPLVFERLLNPPEAPQGTFGIQTVEVSWPEEGPKPTRRRRKKPVEEAPEPKEEDGVPEASRGRGVDDWMGRYDNY